MTPTTMRHEGYAAPMLEKLILAALCAGEAISQIYAAPICGEALKADGSAVTDADLAAESIILALLKQHFAEIPVIAEEEAAAGRIPECGGKFFLVDPLDGTREFLSRNGEFTVNIALIEACQPVMGVVSAPALGLLYAGAQGLGARRGRIVSGDVVDWQAVRVRPPAPDGLDVIASRSHLSPETEAFIERFAVKSMLPAGSSLKFCRVAEGAADLYPRLSRTMEWDTAAGDAVLRAAGGRVSTLNGQALLYGKRAQADDADFANPWFVASGGFDPFSFHP